MSISQYDICPCGSGKKIKFCKCKESLHEMERIVKMMSGQQLVAALDRINTILEKHPDAAWCLALKGYVAQHLGEIDLLRDNAQRFLRLQPNNPLALTQLGLSCLFDKKLPEAIRLLLQALAESNRNAVSMLFELASVIALIQFEQANYLTARMYGHMVLSVMQGNTNKELLQMLDVFMGASQISLLVKSGPIVPGKSQPTDAGINERYKEAQDLLRANQILLAESKLEALARSNPQEHCVWQGVLTCAVWMGNLKRQFEACMSMSRIESSDPFTRAYALALAMALMPSSAYQVDEDLELNDLHCSPWNMYTVELDNADLVEQELMARSDTGAIDSTGHRPLPEMEVPIKYAVELYDRDFTIGDDVPEIDAIPNVIGTVYLFGKQTDRNACLVVKGVFARDANRVLTFIDSLSGRIGEPATRVYPRAVMSFVLNTIPESLDNISVFDAKTLVQKRAIAKLSEDLLDLPLYLLNGKTLRETLDDNAFSVHRQAFVLYLESMSVGIFVGDSTIGRFREVLNVPPLKPIQVTDSEQLQSLTPMSLMQVDLDSLDNELLLQCGESASACRCATVSEAVAKRILDRRDEMSADAVYWAYCTRPLCETDQSLCYKYFAEGKQWCIDNERDCSDLLLSHFRIALMANDKETVDRVGDELTEMGRANPEILYRLRAILDGLGLIAPEDAAQHPSDGAGALLATGDGNMQDSDSSRIWTPENAHSVSNASPQQAEGSKLYIPGRD